MILSDVSLMSLGAFGLVQPFEMKHVQGSSIDLVLGESIKVEAEAGDEKWVDVGISDGYEMEPGEFVLAHTEEVIHVPESCGAMVLLRSSAARAGYEHSFAGWCDPGFKGQVTLELRNNLRFGRLPLKAGMRLCQLVVQRLEEPAMRSYDTWGHYQGQMGATAGNDNFKNLAA